MAAGWDEPNALVQVDGEPMVPATRIALRDGLQAISLAARGRLEDDPDERRCDRMHAHCDVLVVGAGPAGLAAADAAARTGARVILASDGGPAAPACRRIPSCASSRTPPRSAATTTASSCSSSAAPGCGTSARSGSSSRPARTSASSPSRATTCPASCSPVRSARTWSATAVVAGPLAGRPDRHRLRPGGRRVARRRGARRARRHRRLRGARRRAPGGRDGRRPPDRVRPARRLGRLESRVAAVDADAGPRQVGRAPGVPRAGRRGSRGSRRRRVRPCRSSPRRRARRSTGRRRDRLRRRHAARHGQRLAVSPAPDPAPVFAIPAPDGTWDRHYVDLQRDATVADVRRAVARGCARRSTSSATRRSGPPPTRARRGNVLALGVLAEALGVPVGELGPTTARPPYVPVSFALYAGRDRGVAARSGPHDADALLARRARRGVRGRRPVEAALLLPARRRGPRRRRPARVRRRAHGRRGDGRLDPRQDRRAGPGRGRVPRPALHQRDEHARGREPAATA